MRTALALLAFFLVAAAAPAPDPLLQRVIAGARAASPATSPFERSVRTTSQEAGGATETRTRSDRWDGRQLTPLTIDGKPATEAQIAEARKAAAGKPVPGYHRLGVFLANGAERIADPQGRTIYRINGLPKGSINVGKDISANLIGDATIDTSGAQPYVSRLRIYLPKPLSFFMVAKLDAFEQVNEYRPGADGRPVIVKGTQTLAGTQFGKTGTTRSEATYTVPR